MRLHVALTKGLPITKSDLTEDGVRVISYGQIHSKSNTGTQTADDLFRHVPAELAANYPASRLCEGDVVFADTSEDVEGLGNAAYIDDDRDAYAGYDAIICRTVGGKLDGKYLAYLARTDAWRSQIRSYTTGVKVFHLTQSLLRRVWVILPSIDEQRKIVKELDARCSAIDSAVSTLEREVSTLESYRSSLIYEAVTKGVDHLALTRPTLLSWCGSIPEGWKSEPLKLHATLAKGLPITKADLTDDGARVISYGQIHSKSNTGTHTGDDLFRHVSTELAANYPSARLREGDVVFADTSEDVEGLGNAAYIDDGRNAFAGYHSIICRPDGSGLSGKYLAYLARTDAWRSQLRAYALGVKVFSVTQTTLRKTWVLLPPIEEQEKIVEKLDSKCRSINSVIESKKAQIHVLKKLRQSVIYEYVTGRRRVTSEG
ncbi:MAG: restriction endonuclease subunit S [Atopobiaceae bacterium]|jgi:type I restriction enzyme S subunit|nr:restriction endonuclease subunit S [Atopobiaceae bacterium]MCH4119089.1 restriction endonuclease subunit S [Atopobiaceae bacterium]MCI1318177.1 restriction endonuclease subunit S [Atopobiaceae bacterium]MCI1388652.1 restriction endonuclease subunit S [Atopobiaceae bacterium]MCI1432151.1 restriction endonuclease subunit S [Atopobiaceae bacterium]